MKSAMAMFAFIALFLLVVVPAFAVTHHVPADFTTIQAGLDASANGDTVLVQPGTYYENIVWPQTNGIKLIAAGDANNTFIDGNQVDRVITMSSGGAIDASTLIQGFTIKNGSTPDDGGGIYCYFSSPMIMGCNISNNHSISEIGAGGGLFCHVSSPTINNCMISLNSAVDGGGIYSRSGSNPTFSGCTISGNTASSTGGGISCETGSAPIISDCDISENSAIDGGGISCIQSSSPTINNSTITGNSAVSYGGGIAIRNYSNPTISNCTISSNSAANGGGIFCESGSDPTINNCAITDNMGEGVFVSNAGGPCNPLIDYNDVFSNSGGDFGGPDVDPDLGVVTGVNANDDPCDLFFNISMDPSYANPNNGDFHLQATSPCIDAGNPAEPLDPDGTVADIGAFYFDQADLLPVTVTLTPTSPTYLPAAGGTISYGVHVVSNVGETYPNVMFWTKVKLPNGSFYPQIQFQTTFTLTPYMDVTGSLSQDIPGFAPAGDYEMWGWVGQSPNGGPSFGGFFPFMKDEGVVDGSIANDWTSNGNMIMGDAAQTDALPTLFTMKPAYPNPFNAATTITVSLSQPAHLNASVFNIAGREVATLAPGRQDAGLHTLTFDASDLASGVYFIRAEVRETRFGVTSRATQTQKVMLLR